AASSSRSLRWSTGSVKGGAASGAGTGGATVPGRPGVWAVPGGSGRPITGANRPPRTTMMARRRGGMGALLPDQPEAPATGATGPSLALRAGNRSRSPADPQARPPEQGLDLVARHPGEVARDRVLDGAGRHAVVQPLLQVAVEQAVDQARGERVA